MLTFEYVRSKMGEDDVTRERDSDSETENTPAVTRSLTSGLRSFLPSFSNSKYARAHRRDSVRLPPGVREPGRLIKDTSEFHVEPKVWLANESKLVSFDIRSVIPCFTGLLSEGPMNTTCLNRGSFINQVSQIWRLYVWRC